MISFRFIHLRLLYLGLIIQKLRACNFSKVRKEKNRTQARSENQKSSLFLSYNKCVINRLPTEKYSPLLSILFLSIESHS